MIPQLSKLKSHLRKNTSEPANKAHEALTSACLPPGPSRRNVTSTPPTSSRSPPSQSPPLTSARCKDTSCARHTSSRSPTPQSPSSTPAPPRRATAPRASSRSPVQLNDHLRPRASPSLRQPTRTKAEQAAACCQSLRDAEDDKAEASLYLNAANLNLTEELRGRYTRSPYTTYMFNTAPPEPIRRRKPSRTQPTRKRAERVAAGDCMGRECFSAFCRTSCAFNPSEPVYRGPALVSMSAEPDVEEMLLKPITFWTSIKQIRPIDPPSSKSDKKRRLRRFIKDLIDCLKACGKLLLVAVGCTCVFK